MVKKTLDILSILAATVVMVVIIYSSSALLDGRFYEEDVQTSWDDIAESFTRWEYAERALAQEETGSVTIETQADRLYVTNVNGPVTISVWDQDYTRVEYDLSAVPSHYRDDVYAEVRSSSSGRSIETATHYRPNAPGVTGAVGYHIYLSPHVSHIEVNTVSGEISMDNLCDDTAVVISMVSSRVHIDGGHALRVNGHGGEIDFSLNGGSAKIDVYSSAVTGSFRQFFDDQEISIKSVTGNISLTIPEDLYDVAYQVRTSTGSISLSPELARFRREGMFSEARGVVGSAKNRITLETTSGNINLLLSGDDRDLLDLEEFRPEDSDGTDAESQHEELEDTASE